MGELLDALNALNERAATPDETSDSLMDLAGQAFRSASQTVNDAIEAIQEPGMPLDMLSRWTRRSPLQAVSVAFLVGVLVTRRR